MSSPDQVFETQMNNIQCKTGRTLGELTEIIKRSGLSKQGEIRAMFHREMGLGHGDANLLTRAILKSASMRKSAG